MHSNIIPIFDFGKVGEEYYLAEEYILGRTLESLARKAQDVHGGPLPVELVLFVAQEALRALSYAHSRTDEAGAPMGLVHRDITPSNLMVSTRGEVKLLDFGIAKLPGRASQTQHGVLKGNIPYMAPEQARGLPVDARADLFSLGLVLYRCLAGRALYAAPEVHQSLAKAVDGPGEDDWRAVRALPEPAPRLLCKALQPDPAMRFASAEEFAAAIPALPRTTEGALAELVQELFSDDLRREQQRLRTAIASVVGRLAASTG